MKVARRIGCRRAVFTIPAVSSLRNDATLTWWSQAFAIALGICLFAVMPAICHGQFSGGSDVPEPNAEHYALIMRAQAVLIELPQMFQRDAELEAQRTAYESALVKAMVELDPQTEQRLARLAEVQAQAMAGSEDQGRLLEEGRELRDGLLATAAQARSQPPVAAVAESLVDALKASVEKLDAVDADTRRLVTEGDLLIESVTVMSLLSR